MRLDAGEEFGAVTGVEVDDQQVWTDAVQAIERLLRRDGRVDRVAVRAEPGIESAQQSRITAD